MTTIKHPGPYSWWCRLSPNCRYVAGGAGIVTVWDTWTGEVRTIGKGLFGGGWVDDDSFIYTDGETKIIRVDGNVPRVLFERRASSIEAGPWGVAWNLQASPYTTFINGKQVRTGVIGCRADDWGNVVSAAFDSVHDGRYFYRWKNGVLEAQFATKGNTNEFRVGANGWIGYGYYGLSYLASPDGTNQLIVNVTPEKQESPALPFLNGDVLWLCTTNDRGIYLFPYGSTDAIHLKYPAIWAHVRVRNGSFYVVSHDDKGRCTFSMVPTITDLQPVEPITVPSQEEPVNEPSVKIISYEKVSENCTLVRFADANNPQAGEFTVEIANKSVHVGIKNGEGADRSSKTRLVL